MQPSISDTLTIALADSPPGLNDWVPAAVAIFAALTAFGAAIYGIAVQRKLMAQQRVTDARRAWIVEFREAAVGFLHSVMVCRTLTIHKADDSPAVVDAVHEVMRNGIIIRLMLDPQKEQHAALASALLKAMKAIDPDNASTINYAALMSSVEESAAQLLDEAWSRIKRGD
jgi:hypothetical protein